jgi:KaiC/GvpD/RAD55 family RecA-like ATPase
VAYIAESRPVEDVQNALAQLNVDAESLVTEGRLFFYDYYTAGLAGGRLESAGRGDDVFELIQGGLRARSLLLADLSIRWLKDAKYGPAQYDVVESWPPGSLVIAESASQMLRFNKENEFIEYAISRANPNERKAKRINVTGFVSGIHSQSFYKHVEAACDGVIELRIDQRSEQVKNLLRLTSLKNQPHDTRWHEVEIKPNGEANIV